MIHSVIRRAIFDVFDNNYEYFPAACSMQHAIFDLFDIPWMLQRSSFSHSSFGGKVSLIISIIDLRSDLNTWPINSLILPTIPWMTQLSSFNHFGAKISQFAHRFHRVKTYFGIFDLFDITFKLRS